MTVEQLVQDLRAAAQVVRDKGWCTGTYQAVDGRVCAEGALRVAVFGGFPLPKYYKQTPEAESGDQVAELFETVATELAGAS